MPAKKDLKKSDKSKKEDKSKKQESSQMSQTKKDKAKKMKLKAGPFRHYLQKLFKGKAPNNSITRDALQITDDFIMDILQKMADTISDLSKFRKVQMRKVYKKDKEGNKLEGEENIKVVKSNKTLGVQEVISAIKLNLPQQLQEGALEAFNLTVQEYQTAFGVAEKEEVERD